jgi:hypothetical protein
MAAILISEIAVEVYQEVIIGRRRDRSNATISPEIVIKKWYFLFPLTESNVVNVNSLRQMWENDCVKNLNLHLHNATGMQTVRTKTKHMAASVVADIKRKQDNALVAIKELKSGQKKAIPAVQKEAVAKATALAEARNWEKEKVLVSMSSKKIHWDEALKIANEAKQSWELALIATQFLSRGIDEMCQVIDVWHTDYICDASSRLKMDTDITNIASAFAVAEAKISEAIKATKEMIRFSSQLDSSL